ncbi:MAG: S-layer homology domain-containing protein, partial [Acidimicrobiia bacterium]
PEAGADQDGWFQPADFECPEGTVPYHYQGLFADDDGSVFKEDIEWLAASGITRGCNPPFNDWFCPEQSVTRAQMAAFLVRALALPATEWDFFSDDEGSVFEDDINRLAAAGITKGCNPPDNTRFCPQESITRGQMAAFLVRAYLLGPAVAAGFVDIAGSVFAGDIDRLAAAGITKGCDPPSNTMFCPEDPVTRGQMAAFIRRAETGSRP